MPNDTDLTEFRRVGMAGLNFAMADGWASYHQPQDTPEALDRGSLQHFGSYALALTRQFGSVPLDNPNGENYVYFTVAGRLLDYPQAWSAPLALLAGLCLAAVVMLGTRRRRLNLAQSALAVGVFVLNLLLAGALGFLAIQVLTGPLHENAIFPTYDVSWYTAGFAALALAGTLFLYRVLGARLGAANLAAGAAAGWLCLALLSAFALPGASYLFVWPLFGSVVALALGFAAPRWSAIRPWAALLPAVTGLLLFVPALWILLVLMPVALYWASAAIAGCVWALVVPHMAS